MGDGGSGSRRLRHLSHLSSIDRPALDTETIAPIMGAIVVLGCHAHRGQMGQIWSAKYNLSRDLSHKII